MSNGYEYKGYTIEEPNETKTPLPQDIKSLFDRLNHQGLSHPRDPLCCDMNYTKSKYRFSVIPPLPTETKAQETPKQIEQKYKDWFVNEWSKKSMFSKLLTILWYLPAHLYRKYVSTIDYRFYYNGLVSFVNRTYEKIKKK